MWAIMTAIFGGWRNFFFTTFAAGLIVLFRNKFFELFVWFISWAATKAAQQMGINIGSGVSLVSLTGFAAYMADCLRFTDIMALWIQAYMAKWYLRKIPFFRW